MRDSASQRADGCQSLLSVPCLALLPFHRHVGDRQDHTARVWPDSDLVGVDRKDAVFLADSRHLDPSAAAILFQKPLDRSSADLIQSRGSGVACQRGQVAVKRGIGQHDGVVRIQQDDGIADGVDDLPELLSLPPNLDVELLRYLVQASVGQKSRQLLSG